MAEAVGGEAASRPSARARLAWILAAGLVLVAALLLGLRLLRKEEAIPEPERLRVRLNKVVQNLVRDHWLAMRQAVAQLRTDEGARAFFAANPGLALRVPSEAAFVEKVRGWRPLLPVLPEALPDLATHDLSYSRNADSTELGYRTPKGARIFMRWTGDRLVEIRVY